MARVRKLKELGEIITGSTPSMSDSRNYESNDICFIKPSDIHEEAITALESSEFFIAEYALKKARIVPKGSILVTCIGSIGKIGITEKECSFNQQINAILPNEELVDTSFLAHYLSYKKKELQDLANSAVVPIINKSQFSEVEIKLPRLEHQKKIANLLNFLDNIISLRKDQLTKLDQLVKTRFVEMFGCVENNIFNFPICSIGDYCSLKSGTTLPSDVENEGGSIPYIKVADMNISGNEKYITASSRYVTEETAGKRIFPSGAVVFPKRGGAIGTNKKRLTQCPICADLNVMGVIPGEKINSFYLLSYFDMVDLGSLDNGSSVPQVNNKDIAPLKFLLPPLPLQEEFAAFVQKVDKSKAAVKQSLEKLETLKKSLMQEYFG